MCSLAVCCTSSPARPENASSSTAPSGSAPRWRCRPRRMPALPRRAISRAASTPGRRPAGRWRADEGLSLPSAPIGFRELGGAVELAELDHLAIADREHVHPVARHLAAGLADIPGIVAEHADAIVGGEEFAR